MSIEFLVVSVFLGNGFHFFELETYQPILIFVVSSVDEMLGVVRLAKRSNRDYLDLS